MSRYDRCVVCDAPLVNEPNNHKCSERVEAGRQAAQTHANNLESLYSDRQVASSSLRLFIGLRQMEVWE